MALGIVGIAAGFILLNAGVPAGVGLVIVGALYWAWRVQ
jgi:hypothetical protein